MLTALRECNQPHSFVSAPLEKHGSPSKIDGFCQTSTGDVFAVGADPSRGPFGAASQPAGTLPRAVSTTLRAVRTPGSRSRGGLLERREQPLRRREFTCVFFTHSFQQYTASGRVTRVCILTYAFQQRSCVSVSFVLAPESLGGWLLGCEGSPGFYPVLFFFFFVRFGVCFTPLAWALVAKAILVAAELGEWWSRSCCAGHGLYSQLDHP